MKDQAQQVGAERRQMPKWNKKQKQFLVYSISKVHEIPVRNQCHCEMKRREKKKKETSTRFHYL